MFSCLSNFKLTPKEKIKIELAIWFHDILYDSQRRDNELKSAEEFMKFAKKAKINNQGIVDEIADLILITKHTFLPRSELEKNICDCDLFELAADNSKKNGENVRKKYAFLSDEEWIEGRSNFLKEMLRKPHIFHTDAHRGVSDEVARINIQKELDTINII